jgi:hypothetical protein
MSLSFRPIMTLAVAAPIVIGVNDASFDCTVGALPSRLEIMNEASLQDRPGNV